MAAFMTKSLSAALSELVVPPVEPVDVGEAVPEVVLVSVPEAVDVVPEVSVIETLVVVLLELVSLLPAAPLFTFSPGCRQARSAVRLSATARGIP
jgi:hypothetical protein